MLSPESNRVAFINNISESVHFALLATYDLDKRKRYLLLKSDNDDIKCNWFRWANNDTLIISAKYGSKQQGRRYYQTRSLSMRFDAEGVKPKVIIKPRWSIVSPTNSNHTSPFQYNSIGILGFDKPCQVRVFCMR
jgi:hypothetical protein